MANSHKKYPTPHIPFATKNLVGVEYHITINRLLAILLTEILNLVKGVLFSSLSYYEFKQQRNFYTRSSVVKVARKRNAI